MRIGSWHPAWRAALLPVPVLLVFAILLPIAWRLDRAAGVEAAAMAAIVCLVAGWLAMLVTTTVAPPTQPTAHILVGMAIRMSLPLLACLWVVTQVPDWADAKFGVYLIPTFLAGLVLETLVTVGQLQIHSDTQS